MSDKVVAVASVSPFAVTLAEIRQYHRERCYAMEQRKRADLALMWFLRTQLGWRRDLPDDERKVIAERAKVIAQGASTDDLEAARWRPVVEATERARKPFDDIEHAATKAMQKLAQTLPVWAAFGQQIRGFGEGSLAVIIGEAGNLAVYANPAKLWKRMGLGLVDGVRQGGLRKGASDADWIAHGYSPQRRSRMWNVGDALIKSNRDGKYRTIYLERKAYEKARAPEMTDMHAHRRAQRYMEKRLLRDLWNAWQRTMMLAPFPVQDVPAVVLHTQAAVTAAPAVRKPRRAKAGVQAAAVAPVDGEQDRDGPALAREALERVLATRRPDSRPAPDAQCTSADGGPVSD